MGHRHPEVMASKGYATKIQNVTLLFDIILICLKHWNGGLHIQSAGITLTLNYSSLLFDYM